MGFCIDVNEGRVVDVIGRLLSLVKIML
jgi:hypothetical protein